jgi:hypothetical protein
MMSAPRWRPLAGFVSLDDSADAIRNAAPLGWLSPLCATSHSFGQWDANKNLDGAANQSTPFHITYHPGDGILVNGRGVSESFCFCSEPWKVGGRLRAKHQPAPDGSVFLVASKGGNIALPGVTLRARRGSGLPPDDFNLRDNLYCMSTARALIEDMRPDAISALRALSANAWPEPIIKTLAFSGDTMERHETSAFSSRAHQCLCPARAGRRRGRKATSPGCCGYSGIRWCLR